MQRRVSLCFRFLVNHKLQDWDLTAAWRVANAMTDVSKGANGEDLVKSNGYGVVDLYARYRASKWALAVGIDNVLDKEYLLYENIAGLTPDADLQQYSQPGRAFSANLSYQC